MGEHGQLFQYVPRPIDPRASTMTYVYARAKTLIYALTYHSAKHLCVLEKAKNWAKAIQQRIVVGS